MSHASPRRLLSVSLCALTIVALGGCTGQINSATNNDGPGDPVKHNDPTDPSNPTDPSDPSTPSDPSDPNDPADPHDPPDPDDPPIIDDDPPHSGGDPNADPHPNLVPQAELFMCDGSPSSSPARVRRITPVEWARATYKDTFAQTIPFLAGQAHAYDTYATDETLDAPTLQEVLRATQSVGSSWRSSDGNSGPRLAIMRNDSPAKSATRCFQNKHGGPVADPDDACIRSFLGGLLEYGILFRPASEEDIDSLWPFAKQLVAEEKTSGLDLSEARGRTINMIARAAWLMPSSLFRPELGGQPDADGRRRLSDWEVGLAITYALGNTSPGQSKEGYQSDATHKTLLPEIRQAMEQGTITDPSTLEAIVRYHIAGRGTPRATMTIEGDEVALDAPMGPDRRYQTGSSASTIEPFYEDEYWMSRKLEGFFHQWLGHDTVYDVFKDTPEATSAYTEPPDRTPSYRHRKHADKAHGGGRYDRLLDNMIARIVVEDKDVLKQLLTTRRFLLPSGGDASGESAPYKGYVYDIDIDSGGTLKNDIAGRWVQMPSDERAGVLTHPAWLSAHGGNFENDPNPIYRGKWVWENLLCGWIDELPVGVNAMLPPETADASTRTRFGSAGIDQGFCANCHGSMNPLGYAFEIYNHAGYMRADDHGAAPNGAATLQFTPVNQTGDGKQYATFSLTPGDTVLQDGMQVRDAVEMMEAFGDSRHVKQCFIRHSFRYFMGRDETKADACTLAKMETAYDDSEGSMISMIVALFQSDAFMYRHTPADEEAPQ